MKKILLLCLCTVLAALLLSIPALAAEDWETGIDTTAAVGDLDGSGAVDNLDVEYLLWYTLFPEEYPLTADGDFDQNDTVDNLDVEYLLWYTLFPEEYPLPEPAPHEHSYTAVVTPPTATQEGYTTYSCACGDSYTGDTVPPVGIGELKFSAAALVLRDNLNVCFYADANLFIQDAYTQPYAVFQVGSKTQTVSSYELEDGYCVFYCTNLAPSQAGDTITATLYATLNGQQHSFTQEYSAATYCYSMLEKTDNADLRRLLVDLLNYSAATQVYAWYNDKTLCNAQLTEQQQSWGTNTVPPLSSRLDLNAETVENPTISWTAAGLVLDTAITMRFRFSAESLEGLTVQVCVDGQTWEIDSFQPIAGEENSYYAYFHGMRAHQMRQLVTATVLRDGVPVSNTLGYSIETYAYNKQYEDRLGTLVIAMMRYGDSAANYGAHQALPKDEF